MHIKSFVDVITTDSNYSDLSIAFLDNDRDCFSNAIDSYTCTINNKTYSVDVYVPHLLQEFRGNVFTELKKHSRLILIDNCRGKIYSNIQNDEFLDRLGQNVVYDQKRTFQFKRLKESKSLQAIITKAFPFPEKVDEQDFDPWLCAIL